MTEEVIGREGGDCRMRAALDGDPSFKARSADRVGEGVLLMGDRVGVGVGDVLDGEVESLEERNVRYAGVSVGYVASLLAAAFAQWEPVQLPSPIVGSAMMWRSEDVVGCCVWCCSRRARQCVKAGTMDPGSVSGVGRLARSWGVTLSQNRAELICV